MNLKMLASFFQNRTVSLIMIFILAVLIRLLYFPQNIYFGFDQARDAFISQQILHGNLKVVGPPTAIEGLFHGPLHYYIYAPIYFLSQGDPVWVALSLRIINASAVFLVFLVGTVIFSSRVGVLSAFLFAISFEQTQYALSFNHPSLAVISVLIFYLGLSLLIFKKEQKGLLLALFGLGLSIQFELTLIYLCFILLVLLVFYNQLAKIKFKNILFSIGIFLATISTFIISEIKFKFGFLPALLSIISIPASQKTNILGYFQNILLISQRALGDNFLSFGNVTTALLVIMIITFTILWRDKTIQNKLFFLLIWFCVGILPYLGNKSETPLYYYSVGASISLLIFGGILIDKFSKISKWASLLILIPLFSNMNLITSYNQMGPIPTIHVQSGMLLKDEKKVIDYVYQKAQGELFAINSLSMPLYVNTTWSYLFEWYGQERYGYLPIWGGESASGYPGNLKVITARSDLPEKIFLVIEPTRGIRPNLIQNFIENENYFSDILEEKKFGLFIVQYRKYK